MDTIFISYRREESAGHAGRIYDRLRERFGRDRAFMDVSAIEPGVDFVEAIDHAVSSCAVLLVVIGRKWQECTDATGRRRLDDPNDFIRLEVGTALRRNIRVIPVLVQGAAMPVEAELPDDLKLLARRNAIEVNDTHWDSDLAQLVDTLDRVLAGVTGPAPATKGASAESATAGRKSRLTWLISSITAVVLALTGLFTGIESFRDAFVRLFKGAPAVTGKIITSPPGTISPPTTQGPIVPASSTVPKVLGMQEQEAVATLRAAGFSPSTEQRISPDDRPGTVFHQDPLAGASLPSGAGVILHVAKAPPPKLPPATAVKVTVPDVVGQTLEQARSTLKKQGFSVEVAGEHDSSDVPAGTVLRHFPKAGDRLERGGKVGLVMATRPAGPELVPVPNVVRQPLERAVKMLKGAGLQPGAETPRPTDKLPSGMILDQKPKGGSQAGRWSKVDLLVSVQSTPLVPGGQIQVRCSARPSSITAGGRVEIRVLALTEQNSPVAGADVRIVSGGGWFSKSGTTTEIGQTDSRGALATQWRSPKPAAAAYVMSVTITKDGFTEGRGECRVLIQQAKDGI